MADYFVTYHELLSLPREPDVWIPGKRVRMTEEQLFAVWLSQHRERIEKINFGCEGTCFHDQAVNAWLFFPDLVENG